MDRAKQSTGDLVSFTLRLKITLLYIFIASFHSPGLIARTVAYFYVDHHGSMLVTTDANGAVISSIEYRPYGASALGDGAQSLGYAGHVKDDDVSLIYMQARYYDPATLRFLSRDPAIYAAGALDGFGRYGFSSNNPFRYIDPNGMASCGEGIDGPACVYPESRLPRDEGLPNPFALSSSDGEKHRDGCDSAECDEVKQTRAKILQDQSVALQQAGEFGAKEGAMFLVGGYLGKVLGRVAGMLGMGERIAVTFGANENQILHAFRHIDAVGLPRAAVRDAVMADLKLASRQIQTGQLYRGTVQVGGREVTYNAFRLPDGSINIGRLTPGVSQ